MTRCKACGRPFGPSYRPALDWLDDMAATAAADSLSARLGYTEALASLARREGVSRRHGYLRQAARFAAVTAALEASHAD